MKDKTLIIILCFGIAIFSVFAYSYTKEYQEQTTRQLTEISNEIQNLKTILKLK